MHLELFRNSILPFEDLNENMVISQQGYDFCKLGEPIEYESKVEQQIS